MKISSIASAVSTNNQNSSSYDFNIGDVGTIIEILRNRLYSNPIQTLTQEYLCNARDSHREAGKSDTPIKVTLPTKLESCLKVRDFGVGLSKDRVCDVFVKYGKSTKRIDNVQTGGFGLGAKSAWAYTDSFVVVSYYNGICSTYVAHTGKSSNGTFELINEVETDEPNGVEVQIPIKESDIEKFIKAVYRTTYFWDTKPELHGITDIEIPSGYLKPHIKYQKNSIHLVVADDFIENLFETRHVNCKTFVLIDKIPYRIDKFQYQVENLGKLNNVVHKNNVVFIEVNNGDIDVAASREEVSNDASNIAKLEKVCEVAHGNIWSIVKEEFDVDFENLNSFVNAYSNLKETFTFNHIPKNLIKLQYSYQDHKFTITCLHETRVKNNKFDKVSCYYKEEQETRTIVRCEDLECFSTDESDRVVIQDCDYSNVIIKRKIKKLLDENEDEGYVYLIRPSDSPATKADIDTFKKVANCLLLSELKHDVVTYAGKKKEKGHVSIYTLTVEHGRNGRRVENAEKRNISLDELEQNGKYVLVNPEKHDFRDEARFVLLISYMIANGIVPVKCNKSEYAKISNLSNVFEFDDFVANLEKNIPLSNEKIDQIAFSSINQTIFSLKKFSDSIVCPKITNLFSLYPNINRDHRNYIDQKILNRYSYYLEACKKFEKAKDLEKEVTEDYPLLSSHFYGLEHHLKEFVYYINNKYQTEYKTKLVLEDGKFCRR